MRAHWSNAAIAAGRREVSMSKRILRCDDEVSAQGWPHYERHLNTYDKGCRYERFRT
jgi:hypothetical protein